MRYLTVFAMLAGLSGCGGDGPTAPAPLVVTISADQRATGYPRMVNGQSQYACDFQVTAKASGGAAGAFAVWSWGTGEYTLNSSGARSSFTMLTSDLVEWFGSDRITASASTASRWAAWSGPFRLVITFRYIMPDGETRAHNYFLYCD